MSGARDGATVSMNRQLDMIRYIMSRRSKPPKFQDVHFYMSVRHGVTKAWVTKYLTQWASWGVVVQKGQGYGVDPEKWKAVQDVRESRGDIFGP